jgi:chloride channel protein, CIC family
VGRGRTGTRRQVVQVMRAAGECLNVDDGLEETLNRITPESQHSWPVCDHSGVIGVVTLEQLQRALQEPQPKKCIGELLPLRDFPHLHTDHSLDLALDRMGATHTDMLPVVSRANIHELLGVVRLHDVLKSYGIEDSGES